LRMRIEASFNRSDTMISCARRFPAAGGRARAEGEDALYIVFSGRRDHGDRYLYHCREHDH
jgi:hypothetical protein